jgi:hypothetical protein
MLENLTSSVVQYKYKNELLVERRTHSISDLPGLENDVTTIDAYEYDTHQNVILNIYSYSNQGNLEHEKLIMFGRTTKLKRSPTSILMAPYRSRK